VSTIEFWGESLVRAQLALKTAQAAIHDLSTQTEGDAEMKLTYAAMSIYGPEALLREADQIHRQLNLPLEDRR
jgi:hypothetical protein